MQSQNRSSVSKPTDESSAKKRKNKNDSNKDKALRVARVIVPAITGVGVLIRNTPPGQKAASHWAGITNGCCPAPHGVFLVLLHGQQIPLGPNLAALKLLRKRRSGEFP